ncbi:MAG: SGNH/GDSL hydrolase family protein [Nitrospinales bacterium]
MTKNLKNILFACVAVALAFALLEGGSRLYLWFQEEPLQSAGQETLAFDVDDLTPYVFFKPLPSLELRPHDQYFFEFDGKKVSAQKQPEEYRIFIMGGSVAQGYGASSPEKKFYNILENLLNEKQPNPGKRYFRVISAGRLGYVSAQELIFLLMGVLDFQPDMAVHLNGVNDVLAVGQYQEGPGYPFYFQTLGKALKAAKASQAIDKALDHSAFFSGISQMFDKYKRSAGNLISTNISRHYRRNMTQAAQILNANGVETFFILQPILLYKKTRSPEEEPIAKRMARQSIQLWKTTYPQFAESLKKISEESNIHWEDFRGVFDEVPETLFSDSVHLNDRGQEALAQALFEAIKDAAYKRE